MEAMKKMIFSIVVLTTLFACNNDGERSEEKPEKSGVVVTTEQSKEQTYFPWLNYKGVIYATREANLGTTLPGKVEKVHHQKGDFVKEGELLVELSGEMYAQALAEKNTLEKDYQRVSRLREKGSISQQEYDHVKAKYEAAKAKARMMKKNSEVRAPFAGTIVEYLVKEGENFMFSPGLKPGYSHTSGIVRLMKMDELKVEIDMNEKDIGKVHKGQEAKVVCDAFQNDTIIGKVHDIDPALSTSTHSGKVEVLINNRERKMKPGMYAKVFLKMEETTDVFVPANSVYRQSGTGRHFVYVEKNGKVERIQIEKLYTKREWIAVDGLEADQNVVVHGKNKIKDGDSVTVKN